MRRIYFMVLTAVTLATLFLMMPNVAANLIWFSFLLLLPPLLLLPMFCFTLWLFLPFFLFPEHSRIRYLFLTIPAVVIVLGPFVLSTQVDKWTEFAMQSQGIIEPSPLSIPKPLGIEIRRSSQPNAYLPQADSLSYEYTPCFKFCERLLTGGDVAWIRIYLRNDGDGSYWDHSIETKVLAISASPGICHEMNPDYVALERCVYYAPDDGRKADITIDFNEESNSWPLRSTKFFEQSGKRGATGFFGQGTSGQPVFNLVQLYSQRPSAWLSFNFGSFSGGDDKGGILISRQEEATPAIDLIKAAQAMGLKVGPVRPLTQKPSQYANDRDALYPPDAQDAIFAASILTMRPKAYKIPSKSYGRVVEDWFERLSYKEKLTETDRSIVCSAALDPNIDREPKDRLVKKFGIKCD